MLLKLELCVGIDPARRANHTAFIAANPFTGPKCPKRAFSFPHTLKGFLSLRDYILKVTGKKSLKDVIINTEPTSGVWRDIARFFFDQGASVFYTRPDVVSALRKTHSRFAKTDRIDSRTLAGMPWSFPERLIPFVPMEKRIRKLREFSNQRFCIVKEITRWKNRFLARIEPAWKPLLISIDKDEVFSQSIRAFWLRFSHPGDVIRLGPKRFHKWCEKHFHGGLSKEVEGKILVASDKANELWQALGKDEEERDSLSFCISQDLTLIDPLEKQLKLVEDRISKARKDVPECDILEEMPGVGDVVSVTLASFLMPITRFSNARKLSAYTGFVSRVKSSGKREIEGLRITKCGNRRLKRDLALAADTAMHKDPQLAAFAVRLFEKGKHYNKVRVAVGRKIAVRAGSLLKRIAAGEKNVHFEYRDLEGRPIPKQEAKELADTIWLLHDRRKKEKKRKSADSKKIVAA